MERTIDTQLEDLKKTILLMGGHVEKSLNVVMTALLTKDLSMFSQIHETEKLINENHVRVDSMCMNILAKQGPVARDLRLIFSIIKINNDLERMGDQTVNIAYSGKDYLDRNPVKPQWTDIEKMAVIAGRMVKGSLDSFVRGDIEQAKMILLMDDEIDALKSKVFKDSVVHMKSHPEDVEATLDLILVSRNLERMGDHATNIAEDVIFAFTGKDVRHGGKVG